jgi:hypothetical protein
VAREWDAAKGGVWKSKGGAGVVLSFELGYTDGFNRTADMAGIGLASKQKEELSRQRALKEQPRKGTRVRPQHQTKQLQQQKQTGEFKRK